MNKTCIVIIQARLGSTRLPGKILMELGGKTVLEQVYERARGIQGVDQVVIATTYAQGDEPLVDFLEQKNMPYFRGSEEDVLSRYYEAAKAYGGESIIRITSDCPLLDPEVSSQMLSVFLEVDYEMVSNAGANPQNRTFPRGLDTEIFRFEDLERAHMKAKAPYQREHVTPYLYENLKHIYYFKNGKNEAHYRWTLDTKEDYEMIQKIYQQFFPRADFSSQEVMAFLQKNPHIAKINAGVVQKNEGRC